MECNFYVGQKVVCVDTFPYKGKPGGINEGEVYTIREIVDFISPDLQRHGICVYLKEVIRPPWHGVEVPFFAKRFRPVTDISIFEEMLNNAPSPELMEELEYV